MPTPVSGEVRVSSSAGLAIVELDHPPLNLLGREVQDGLLAAIRVLEDAGDVRAVVLTGGPRVFSAGLDLERQSLLSPAEAQASALRLQRTMAAVAALGKPTVAAVAGFALGAGLTLALCCDVRVAGDNARLGMPEVAEAHMSLGGGAARLLAEVGLPRARELLVSSRQVLALEARTIGLVDEVVLPADLLDAAESAACRLAEQPTYALRAAKRCLQAAATGDLEQALAVERVEAGKLAAAGQ